MHLSPNITIQQLTSTDLELKLHDIHHLQQIIIHVSISSTNCRFTAAYHDDASGERQYFKSKQNVEYLDWLSQISSNWSIVGDSISMQILYFLKNRQIS